MRAAVPEIIAHFFMHPKSVSILLLAGWLAAGTVVAATFSTPIAITNLTIVPKPGAAAVPGVIVMSGGRFDQIGSSATIPSDALRIDGTGLWAYAGFIDGATHVGVKDAPPGAEEMARLSRTEQDVGQGPRTGMQLANRNGIWPHRTLDDLWVSDSGKLEALRKAGFTSALVTPQTGIMAGQGDLVQLSGDPLRVSILRDRITQWIAPGSNGLRSRADNRAYPGSPMGVVALIRQTMLDARWYQERQGLFVRHPQSIDRIPYDPVLEAVGNLLERRQKTLLWANEPDRIHHALDLAEEFQQDAVVIGGAEAWKLSHRLASRGYPVIASLDWGEKPKLTPEPSDSSKNKKNKPLTRSWERTWENDFFEPPAVRVERLREWEARVSNVQHLLEAGVPVALSGRDLKSPDLFWKRIQEAIDLGLSPDQLLAALTVNPARIFGMEQQLGTIATGGIANLTLLTGSLGTSGNEVHSVFIDGRSFRFPVKAPLAETKPKPDDGESGEDNPKSDDLKSEPDPSVTGGAPNTWAYETEADRKRPVVTGGTLLLQNATVIPVTQGIMQDTDVLVVEGRIRAIGRDLEIPAGATLIDLEGYWIMPGIVDPHSHLAVRGINEGSQSITCEVRQADVVDPTQLGIHRALAGGVTTIHTMHGSANSIGGQNAVLKLKFDSSPAEMLVESGPRIVKFALGENVTRERTPARFPNTRMGVESVMRHAFNDALEYRREWTRYREKNTAGQVVAPLRRDLRLEALDDILKGDLWVHSHCYRADEILRLLTVAEDYGFRIATLQHVLEGYRVLPEMRNHGVGGSTFSDWWSYKKEAFDAIPYNAAMMHRAGIVTSLNSDSDEVIRHLNLEAAKTLRFGGLTADEAVRLITLNPAIQIGLGDRIGSIETGKDGDLAVFNGHPLDTHSRAVMTVIEGEIFFAECGSDFASLQPGPAARSIPAPPRPVLQIPVSKTGRYAIVGATVHPVASDPIPDGFVLIENGNIRAVGPRQETPRNTAVVDASGLHLFPGLINAASQLGMVEISGISQTVDVRELARFQPDLRAVSAFNAHSEHIAVVVCEGITTAHLIPDGGVLSGRSGVVQMSGWSLPEMIRASETGLAIRLPSLPANLVSDDREKRLTEHEKAILEIEAYFDRSRHYAEVTSGKAADPAVRDLGLEAMRPYVTGGKPVFFRASSYKEIQEALRFAEVFGLKPVILGGGEAWKCASQLASHNIPVILTEVFSIPNSRFEPWDSCYANAAALERAGVLFCIATDGVQFARQLPVHAGMAVAHGLSTERAIRSMTLDAALILGLGESIGSIEPGKTADLILTNGDPTQASTRTVGCFIAGQPIELTSLHERNYEKFQARPRPKLKTPGALRGPPAMR